MSARVAAVRAVGAHDGADEDGGCAADAGAFDDGDAAADAADVAATNDTAATNDDASAATDAVDDGGVVASAGGDLGCVSHTTMGAGVAATPRGNVAAMAAGQAEPPGDDGRLSAAGIWPAASAGERVAASAVEQGASSAAGRAASASV